MFSLFNANQNRLTLVNRFGLRKYNPFRQVFTDRGIDTTSINTNWLVGKRLFLTPTEKILAKKILKESDYESHL